MKFARHLTEKDIRNKSEELIEEYQLLNKIEQGERCIEFNPKLGLTFTKDLEVTLNKRMIRSKKLKNKRCKVSGSYEDEIHHWKAEVREISEMDKTMDLYLHLLEYNKLDQLVLSEITEMLIDISKYEMYQIDIDLLLELIEDYFRHFHIKVHHMEIYESQRIRLEFTYPEKEKESKRIKLFSSFINSYRYGDRNVEFIMQEDNINEDDLYFIKKHLKCRREPKEIISIELRELVKASAFSPKFINVKLDISDI